MTRPTFALLRFLCVALIGACCWPAAAGEPSASSHDAASTPLPSRRKSRLGFWWHPQPEASQLVGTWRGRVDHLRAQSHTNGVTVTISGDGKTVSCSLMSGQAKASFDGVSFHWLNTDHGMVRYTLTLIGDGHNALLVGASEKSHATLERGTLTRR